MLRAKNFIRGCEKGYCSLELPSNAKNVSCILVLLTNKDRKIPCRIYNKPGTKDWIVSYPLIDKAFRLTVEYDVPRNDASLSETTEVALTHKTNTIFLPTVFTKYLSKIHSFLGVSKAVALRGSEKAYDHHPVHIESKTIIQAGSKVYFFGTLQVLSDEGLRENTESNILLQLFDVHGNVVHEDTVPFSSFEKRNGCYTYSFVLERQAAITATTICCSSAEHATHEGYFDCVFESFPRPFIKNCLELWHKKTTAASEDPDYEDYFFRSIKISSLQAMRQRTHRFDTTPKYSLIVPLFNTPADFFSDMVSSVLSQTYANWELILANASPDTVAPQTNDPEAAFYVPKDDRIKVFNLEENLGIALNTQNAIKFATGEFVAFLDHDDFIEPNLLFEYTKGINTYPDTDLLYCDEDKFEKGHYFAPFLKPDWSPDLLLSCNYVTHMLCIRHSILKTLEPLSKEYEGAQDFHLTWRAAENARNIYHARKVLYHWRLHSKSTAKNSEAKPYTNEAGKRAVASHIEYLGLDAVPVDSQYPNMFNIDFRFESEPLVTIVIYAYENHDELRACIESVLQNTAYNNYEIICVSASEDIPEWLESYKTQALIRWKNVQESRKEERCNTSKRINYGVERANGEFVLLLRGNLRISEKNWVHQLLGYAQRRDVGAVGAKLVLPNGLVEHAGYALHRTYPKSLYHCAEENSIRYFGLLNFSQNLLAVSGACLMVRKSTFEKAGGMDEALPSDYNAVDFCLKLHKDGLLNVYAAGAILFYEKRSEEPDHFSEEESGPLENVNALFKARWIEYFIKGDPYMNPQEMPGCDHHQLNKFLEI